MVTSDLVKNESRCVCDSSDPKTGTWRLEIDVVQDLQMYVLDTGSDQVQALVKGMKGSVTADQVWQSIVNHEFNHWDTWELGFAPQVTKQVEKWESFRWKGETAAASCALSRVVFRMSLDDFRNRTLRHSLRFDGNDWANEFPALNYIYNKHPLTEKMAEAKP